MTSISKGTEDSSSSYRSPIGSSSEVVELTLAMSIQRERETERDTAREALRELARDAERDKEQERERLALIKKDKVRVKYREIASRTLTLPLPDPDAVPVPLYAALSLSVPLPAHPSPSPVPLSVLHDSQSLLQQEASNENGPPVNFSRSIRLEGYDYRNYAWKCETGSTPTLSNEGQQHPMSADSDDSVAAGGTGGGGGGGTFTINHKEVANFVKIDPRLSRLQHCVMCGKQDVSIPAQNKNICKLCDSCFWLHLPGEVVFKFCKGCKNFFVLEEFADKPEGTKCKKCRKRGRQNYLSKKLNNSSASTAVATPDWGSLRDYPRSQSSLSLEVLSDAGSISPSVASRSPSLGSIDGVIAAAVRMSESLPTTSITSIAMNDVSPEHKTASLESTYLHQTISPRERSDQLSALIDASNEAFLDEQPQATPGPNSMKRPPRMPRKIAFSPSVGHGPDSCKSVGDSSGYFFGEMPPGEPHVPTSFVTPRSASRKRKPTIEATTPSNEQIAQYTEPPSSTSNISGLIVMPQKLLGSYASTIVTPYTDSSKISHVPNTPTNQMFQLPVTPLITKVSIDSTKLIKEPIPGYDYESLHSIMSGGGGGGDSREDYEDINGIKRPLKFGRIEKMRKRSLSVTSESDNSPESHYNNHHHSEVDVVPNMPTVSPDASFNTTQQTHKEEQWQWDPTLNPLMTLAMLTQHSEHTPK